MLLRFIELVRCFIRNPQRSVYGSLGRCFLKNFSSGFMLLRFIELMRCFIRNPQRSVYGSLGRCFLCRNPHFAKEFFLCIIELPK